MGGVVLGRTGREVAEVIQSSVRHFSFQKEIGFHDQLQLWGPTRDGLP